MDRSEESPSTSTVEEPFEPEEPVDETCQLAAVTAWRVVTASVTGRSHALRDEGNEDAVGTFVLEDGTLLLALADGAGSASCAAEGARLIVTAALEALAVECSAKRAEQLGSALPQALRTALLKARTAVAQRARNDRLPPRDFAATLLLAAISRDRLAALQVGDGAVVVQDGEGWRRLTSPLRGQHAGETVFVTSRGASRLAEVETGGIEEINALALLSDGLEPVATDISTGVPHAPFFAPLADFAAGDRPAADKEIELESFLGSTRVQERSSDDLSLILAVRPE